MDMNLKISKQRAISVGELVSELQKHDQAAPVGAGGAWIVGIKLDDGFGDINRVEETVVDLVRIL